ASEIKRVEWEVQVQAVERAASRASAAEARQYYEQACDLTDDAAERAALLARAGEMASSAADPDAARALIEESIALYESVGDTHAAARVSGILGFVLAFTGHRDEAVAQMERRSEERRVGNECRTG